MISDVGKVLDPIADKTTQGVVVLLLTTRFPLLWIVVALILIKETFMAITGYMIVKKCDIVLAAEWYGKLSTVIIVAGIVMLLFWPGMGAPVSNIVIITVALSIVLALTLYAVRNFGYLLSKK
jgi:cardiolipin synthase